MDIKKFEGSMDLEPKIHGMSLDYAYSDTAAQIDMGIRDTILGIRLSILAMGIALARMKEFDLYIDLKFRSMNGYIERLSLETRMDQSSLTNWLRIGEAYLKHRSELETINFNDNDGPTKLPFIDRALESNQKQEVFDNIKSMSVREFKAFSRSNTTAKTHSPGKKLRIRENKVYAGESPALILSSELDKQARAFFEKVNLVAAKSYINDGVLLQVLLNNNNELQQLLPIIKRFKRKINEKPSR
jgi:hypothetical protein